MNHTNFIDSTSIIFGLLATNVTTFRTNEYRIGEYGHPGEFQRAIRIPAAVYHIRETNVVYRSNERGCSVCASLRTNEGATLAIYHPMHQWMHEPYVPATERWVITNIVTKEITLLQFPELSVPLERTLSIVSTTNRWRLTSEWKAE